jgi:hypothetical protein
MSTIADRFSQTGPVPGNPANLPDTGVLTPKKNPIRHEERIVERLNDNRDMNTTHDFQYFTLDPATAEEYSAFTNIHNKVMRARTGSSFLGDNYFNTHELSAADIEFYDDFIGRHSSFLGINFKKIGKAIGHAATDVGHAARSVVDDTGHAVRNVAEGAAHTVRAGADDVAHGTRTIGLGVAHGYRAAGLAVAHEQRAEFNAVKPYWKEIAAAAVIGVLAATGVGLPAAIALGGALLTGLNSIPANQDAPFVPNGAGSGAGMGEGGMADGGPDDSDDEDTGDTGAGLTPGEVAARQQAEARQDGQEDAMAAGKKKLMLYGGVVIALVVVYWFFIRKK